MGLRRSRMFQGRGELREKPHAPAPRDDSPARQTQSAFQGRGELREKLHRPARDSGRAGSTVVLPARMTR